MIKRRDYRRIKEPKDIYPRVVMRWFHWAKLPRFVILYWDSRMLEMRYKGLR